jgi:hypothetical protein
LENILDKITLELKEGIIEYLERFITYTNGYSDEHPEKKSKLLHFKIVKELVEKHPLQRYQFSSELRKEMEDEVSK